MWWFAARVDRRFVGTWEHSKDDDAGTLQTFELRGDGMGDLIMPKERWPIRWWYDGRSICMQTAKDSVIGQLIESFQQAVGMRPDHTVRMYVVKVDALHFEYISLGRGRTVPKPSAGTHTVMRHPK